MGLFGLLWACCGLVWDWVVRCGLVVGWLWISVGWCGLVWVCAGWCGLVWVSVGLGWCGTVWVYMGFGCGLVVGCNFLNAVLYEEAHCPGDAQEEGEHNPALHLHKEGLQ